MKYRFTSLCLKAKLSDENSCADKDIRRLQHEVESWSAQLEVQFDHTV